MGHDAALDQDTVRRAQGAGELRGPEVFPDQEGGGGTGLEGLGGMLDVLGREQAAGVAGGVGEGGELVELVELERQDVAVVVLGDEHQVEHADDLVVDEVDERGSDLAGEVVAGEGDDDVLDRPDGHAGSSLGAVSGTARTTPQRARDGVTLSG